MNLNPTQDNEEEQIKEVFKPEEEENLSQNRSDKNKSYTIWVNLPNLKMKKDVILHNQATIADAICSIINFDNPKFKDTDINQLDVYLAAANGDPDDDCPPLEPTQIISHVNYDKFIIVPKNNEDDYDDENKEEEDTEVFCFCFKRKKPQDEVYIKID